MTLDLKLYTMLKPSFCDYSDAYIFGNGAGYDAAAREGDERNKGLIFKNCAPFINCKVK